MSASAWSSLEREIVSCERCPRLRAHCTRVAERKRRAYRDQVYWGKPVPGFGDRRARILLVGLAPAAHGANRTGRMFTGDRSGAWLFEALERAGLANQAISVSRTDGTRVRGVFITAACRCAPPENRPAPGELESCSSYLHRELELLRSLRVVVALGGIAWNAVFRHASRVDPDRVPRPRPAFGHGALTRLGLRPGRPALPVLGCYHPSQQNTQTGRLTRPMFDSVIREAVRQSGP